MANCPAMRIVSYNVRYFGHSTRGLASTRRTVEKIARAVAALDPSPGIVCLQEVETSSLRSTFADPQTHDHDTQLSRFVDALTKALRSAGRRVSYEAYYFPAHTYKFRTARSAIYTTGLAILAREDFTIDHHNAEEPHDITHRHLHPIKGLKQTRICAHLRFCHSGEPAIDVFNTHLSLPSTMSKEFWTSPQRLGYGRNQLEEAKNLVRFVNKERKSDRFVVVGDFNSLPASPVYKYLVSEAGLRDAFAHTLGYDEEALLRWPTAGFMRMRMHLDHVFVGHALRFVDFEGTRPFGDRTGTFHGLSDHAPLIGEYQVGA